MNLHRILFYFLVPFLFFSCKLPTDVVYFQESKDQEKIISEKSFTSVFKVDDIVSIYISAIDMDAARPFNIGQSSSSSYGESGNTTAGQSSIMEPTYLVDELGNIDFPILGKLRIAGLTRLELKELIKEKLIIYVKDPIVKVRLKNFKITVIGEVKSPGSFTIPNERITIVEALGLAGDMNIKGKRENVVVIRENEGEHVYHRIDLTSKAIFDSPVYYLAQNDVLYVEPNNSQIRNSRTNSNTLGIAISLISLAITVLTFIIR